MEAGGQAGTLKADEDMEDLGGHREPCNHSQGECKQGEKLMDEQKQDPGLDGKDDKCHGQTPSGGESNTCGEDTGRDQVSEAGSQHPTQKSGKPTPASSNTTSQQEVMAPKGEAKDSSSLTLKAIYEATVKPNPKFAKKVLPGPSWPLDSHPDRVREYMLKWNMLSGEQISKLKAQDATSHESTPTTASKPACWQEPVAFVSPQEQAPQKPRGRKKADKHPEADSAKQEGKSRQRKKAAPNGHEVTEPTGKSAEAEEPTKTKSRKRVASQTGEPDADKKPKKQQVRKRKANDDNEDKVEDDKAEEPATVAPKRAPRQRKAAQAKTNEVEEKEQDQPNDMAEKDKEEEQDRPNDIAEKDKEKEQDPPNAEKDKEKEQEDVARSEADAKKRALRSRKCCAYGAAKRAAINAGKSAEEAKALAQMAPRIHMEYSAKMSKKNVSIFLKRKFVEVVKCILCKQFVCFFPDVCQGLQELRGVTWRPALKRTEPDLFKG